MIPCGMATSLVSRLTVVLSPLVIWRMPKRSLLVRVVGSWDRYLIHVGEEQKNVAYSREQANINSLQKKI